MNICVYGASSSALDMPYYAAAERLGEIIGRAGHCLIFGGGKEGLMGACARGARAAGAEILGIAPRLFDEPGILYEGCSEFIFTETMRERKALMEEKADAFVLLPGGIGSYEEFFETLTLKQLGLLNKPIVILNTLSYYSPMLEMLRHTAENKFMSKSCLGLYSVCKEPEEVLSAAEKEECCGGSIRRLSDYSK